jgi:hypothetical protein
MQTVAVKATPTHYLIEVEQRVMAQGPAILQRNGKPVGVLLSMLDYQALHSQPKPVPPLDSPSVPAEFLREVEAFEKLKPKLLKQQEYCGRVVAIHQGQVVAVGDDDMEVLGLVWDQFGEVPCYIEKVQPELRRARIPSIWKKK